MNSSLSKRILVIFLPLLLAAATVSFGQQTPASPSPDDLGALLGGLLNGGQGAPSPQDLEHIKAMRDAFLQDAAKTAAAQQAAAAAATAVPNVAAAKGAPAVPAAPDLGALFGGIIKELNIESTPDGNVKINGQEIDPQTALLNMQKEMQQAGGIKPGETPKFLQGVLKPEQLEAIRKQAEAVQPNPEQLQQLELMAQRLQQSLGAKPLPVSALTPAPAATPAPAPAPAPAPNAVPPKPFIP